jgi:Na+-driven multidrug efflux pump
VDEPRVVELCIPYLALVVGSTPLLAISMMLEFALRADRNARTPMAIAAVVTVTKIALNFLWIFGYAGFPPLGLTGAGLATWRRSASGSSFLAVVARADRLAARAARSDLRAPRNWCARSCGWRFRASRASRTTWRCSRTSACFGYGSLAIAAYTVGVRLLAFT